MPSKLPLTLACWDYDRTNALLTGRVRAEGIELNYLPMMMPEPAFRMLRHGEFDIAEMSLSWYARTVTQTSRPFIAIPVFPSRMFRHSCVYVNADSGIKEPEDLKGKRVGCPEYQMTAAVWLKGILADRHGVPVNSVGYLTGGLEQSGRTETPMNLPADIRIEAIGPDQTLSAMLASGEIDALYTAHAPSSFTGDGEGPVRRLWSDPIAVEQHYFAETGIFPIMHVIVIRQDVYEAHRWVARSLMKAFEEARDIARAELFESTALKTMLPWQPLWAEQSRALLGGQFWPYGLRENEKVLDTFLRYSFEQGLSERRLAPEELFAPETLDVAVI
ncbi:4,5-dihydroxyphthalate decarboxylase [Sinosporangium album]|uniref:4,5-dihydroxyphthalate decarboxylase n=1 Tax=Sinosporangium album TaxID=504805 RepID=A0A1G8ISW5_9ACTN|nr:ABC transporter substrate-binding protein [Sinosporangium album]SDI22125.1 4,5-dihydroxyphthalate decarboxylase [Sinosporangium album]